MSTRYSTRINADERCHEVYDSQAAIGADDVMGSFYWDDAAWFGQPGHDAEQLMNELNFAEAKRAGEYTGNSTAGLDGGADIDPDAVYCEVCGCGVTAEDAVLDGEQMVCCDCAAAAVALVAELQAKADAENAARAQAEDDAYGAYVETHGHDPAAWGVEALSPRCPRCKQLFDKLGRCGCDYEPTEQADWTQALVLSGPIFEALCDAADAARAYWAHVPARLKVINDGWAWLLERNVIHCNRDGDLLYPSESTAGLVHVVGVSCSCTAGRWGQHCKHAAAADILGRARRLMNAQKAA